MKSASSKKKCQYYDLDAQKLYKDHVLVKVRDIEELVSLARRVDSCAYYGTRRAVPHAQVVVLPYSSLIHEQTRESLGIKSLKDCVVIIDEAHNLIDAITNVHSFEVTSSQLTQAHTQLVNYYTKYKNKLKPKNQSRIEQVLTIMKNFGEYIKKDMETQMKNLNDFLFATKVDNINLYEVCEFIEKSELSKKLHGFSEKTKTDTGVVVDSSTSGVHAITSFLLALMNFSKDGKILIAKSSIKFILLNPEVYFKKIVDDARSVILAGGTMQPVAGVIQQLFSSNKSRVTLFECGHVIPDDNLLPLCMSRGPSGFEFDFTFTSRTNPKMMDELGNFIINLCNIVPDGIVLFFPSYSYEEEVYKHFEKNDFIRRIERKKKFFREPKTTGIVENVLKDFKKTINNNFESVSRVTCKLTYNSRIVMRTTRVQY
jgi:chromosome transmission fidelity protein 1